MDVPSFITNISGVGVVVNTGTFPSLNQSLNLVVSGGIPGEFAHGKKDVIRRLK